MKKVVTAPHKTLLWIKWLDHSGSNSGWKQVSEYSCEPLICESVGFFIRDGEVEGKRYVSLAQSRAHQPKGVDDTWNDLITIIEAEILAWAEIR